VILFDVGGVLVELTGLPVFLSWLGDRVTPDEGLTLWLTSPTVRAFETGKLEPDAFAELLIKEMNLSLTKEQLLGGFGDWARSVLPGAIELIRRIPRSYTLATLSNSNAVHWPQLMSHPELLRPFQHHFVSYLTGKIKPDEEAFHNVLASIGCAAREVLFLDDSSVNVLAARRVGIIAHQVKGPAQAEAVLREAGVLLP
jgi:HAD superfamily hydrolase (TIGR01509 family)